MTAPDELPNDVAELKAIIRAQQDQNARLEALVASFKKALFGAKSEKIDPAQYELELEDLEGYHPRPVPGDRHPSSQICLSVL